MEVLRDKWIIHDNKKCTCHIVKYMLKNECTVLILLLISVKFLHCVVVRVVASVYSLHKCNTEALKCWD